MDSPGSKVGKVFAMETVVIRSIPELSKFGQFGTRVSLYISHHVIVKEDVMNRARSSKPWHKFQTSQIHNGIENIGHI